MFCVGNIRKDPKGTPYAIKTPLGWSILGPSMTLSFQSNFHINFLSCKDDELLQATERFWKPDFERSTFVLNVPNSKEDRAAYDVMESRLYLTEDITNCHCCGKKNVRSSFQIIYFS